MGIAVNEAFEEQNRMPKPTQALMQGQCIGAMTAYRDMLRDLCRRKRAGHLAGMTNVLVSRDVSEITRDDVMYEFLTFMEQENPPGDIDQWPASDAILYATVRADTASDYCDDETMP